MKAIIKQDNRKHLALFPGFYVDHRRVGILGVFHIVIIRKGRLYFVLFPLILSSIFLASFLENNNETIRTCISHYLLFFVK